MATLRDIQRRIRSVQSTQKITRAMKLVAAAKLRRAQERILAARPYAIKMAELRRDLVGRHRATTSIRCSPGATDRRKRLVVITADKGLCGAFNSNVIRAGRSSFLRERAQGRRRPWSWWAEGARLLRRRQWHGQVASMLGFFDRLAYAHAQELAGRAHAGVPRRARWTRSSLVYNEFRSVAVQRVTRRAAPAHRAARRRGAAGEGAAGGLHLRAEPEAILGRAPAAPRDARRSTAR